MSWKPRSRALESASKAIDSRHGPPSEEPPSWHHAPVRPPANCGSLCRSRTGITKWRRCSRAMGSAWRETGSQRHRLWGELRSWTIVRTFRGNYGRLWIAGTATSPWRRCSESPVGNVWRETGSRRHRLWKALRSCPHADRLPASCSRPRNLHRCLISSWSRSWTGGDGANCHLGLNSKINNSNKNK